MPYAFMFKAAVVPASSMAWHLENNIREQDTVIEEHGVKVVIDEVSIGYMQGASIDYVEDVMGSGFKIDNPNAMSSCGCGNSFEAKDGGGSPSSCGGCG